MNKKKIGIIIAITVVLAVFCGFAAYFIINSNEPSNNAEEINSDKPSDVVKDFAKYYTKKEWEKLDECFDFDGYLAYSVITNNESDENIEDIDFIEFDNIYENIENEVENMGSAYEDLKEMYDNASANASDAWNEYFNQIEYYYNSRESSLKIDSIESEEKIENTNSLYRIKADCTTTIAGQDAETETVEIYVTKIDGNYKIVGGEFADMIFYVYYTLDYYSNLTN